MNNALKTGGIKYLHIETWLWFASYKKFWLCVCYGGRRVTVGGAKNSQQCKCFLQCSTFTS